MLLGMFADIGKLVGRYFQILACMSIIGMIVDLIFYDRLMVDLSVIFLFWCASCLNKHNPMARKITIGICATMLCIMVLLLPYFIAVGIEKATLNFGPYRIHNPSVYQFSAMFGLMTLTLGFPLALLMTRQAKREFGVVQ